MFGDEAALRADEEGRAIEGSGGAFDDTDDEPGLVGGGDFVEPGGGGTGHIDGRFEITAEEFAAFGGSGADAGSKVFAFGVAGEKGLGKDDQLSALGGGFGSQAFDLFDASGDIVEYSSGLDDSGANGHFSSLVPIFKHFRLTRTEPHGTLIH